MAAPRCSRIAGRSAKLCDAVVRAVAPLPVTAKIRIGWDEQTINAVAVARQVESLGVAALAVHGRTRAQGYSGEADWNVIAEVAAAVAIPVIGNGDLFTAADVARRRRETGIAGVMIGRAAMSSPWIFSQTKHFLATGELLAAARAGGEVGADPAALRAGGGGVGQRRHGHALNAWTIDGLHEGNARRKDAPGKVFACTFVRRNRGNRAGASGNLPRSGVNSFVTTAAAHSTAKSNSKSATSVSSR